jgi:hypothetical protein
MIILYIFHYFLIHHSTLLAFYSVLNFSIEIILISRTRRRPCSAISWQRCVWRGRIHRQDATIFYLPIIFCRLHLCHFSLRYVCFAILPSAKIVPFLNPFLQTLNFLHFHVNTRFITRNHALAQYCHIYFSQITTGVVKSITIFSFSITEIFKNSVVDYTAA